MAALHANPTLRRANPLLFWLNPLLQHQQFQARLGQLDEKRLLAEKTLPDWSPVYRCTWARRRTPSRTPSP